MTRAFSVFFGLMCLLLGSCTQRMVCPAYQSAFIYDKDELRKKFSYFQEDSTPKIYTASKTKYLVAEPVSYQRKLRSLQTVQMKPVLVQVPDSLSGKPADSVSMADFDRAARSIIDSTMIVDVPRAPADTVSEPLDSIYVITKDREVRLLKYNTPDSLLYDSVLNKWVPQIPKYHIADVRYNVTQDNYMWYLRDNLILPDVRIARMQQAGAGGEEEREEKASRKEKRKGLKGLFRKKQEEPVDSTEMQAPAEDEFDFIEEADTVSQAEVPQPGQEDKKPSRREKKPKVKKEKKPKKDKKQPEEQPEDKPAEKKEEEDDGF